MDTENKETIDEEAIAEEEFVSDLEDTIENPLVYDGDKLTVQSKKTQEEGEKKEELAGAIGSGELVVNTPFNNEEALRSENMNDGDNPFGSDSTTNKGFDGPDKAPLDDATETIAPSTTPKEEDAPSTTENTESESVESTPATETESESTSTPALGEDKGGSTDTNTETPVVSNAPTAENATEPKKKKKTGLIVGIIVAVLLVGAAIGGVIFYMMHESKEQTVLDAITNLIGGGSQQIGSSVKTDARQFDGTIKLNAVKDAEGLKGMTLAFKSDSKASNFSGSGSLTFDLTTGQSITIDVNAAYISEDGIYFKLDKLKEALSNEALFGSSDLSSDPYSSSSSMSDLSSLIQDILSSAVEAIDGKWFKLDSKTFESDKDAQESYNCVTKALDDMSSKEVKDKIASIYKNHPFIENDDEKGTSDSDGLKYYSVKTSSDKYKAFMNETKELSVVKDLKTCMNVSDSSSSEESEKVTAEIKLGITGWSHELKVIKGNVKSDSTNMDIDVKVGYEEKSVVAPTDSAKSLEDLTKDFMKSFANSPYMNNYITNMAKQSCAGYISNINTYNKCVEETSEKLMAEMMKGMMGQFVPSTTKTSALIQ